MNRNKYISAIVLLAYANILLGQCGFDGNFLVPDVESDNYTLIVSGLGLDNLADVNQGVCGLTLNFEHNSIGDWDVILTSPAGQSVHLVGPIGLFADTENTTWDISFVPCGEVSLPDLGFVQTWDSDQAWGTDNNYIGSYYPNMGCLEDFNIGSANGSWTLFISDNNSIDQGTLFDFSITFCNEAPNVNCMLCTPDGGTIRGSAVSSCEGSPDLNLNLMPTFNSGTPDPAIYNYTYIITSGNIIAGITASSDLTSLSDGQYQIYGLSYLASDVGSLPLIGGSFSAFRNNLGFSDPDICGDVSDNSLSIEIYDTPLPTMMTETICFGDSFQLGDSTFTTMGTKNVMFQSVDGCDSLVVLDLNVINIQTNLLGPDELDCINTEADIIFNGIPLAQLASIIWFNEGGTFFDDSFINSVTVDEAGTYYAAYDFRGCIDTLDKVIDDTNLPSLDLITDTLTCSNRIGRIEAISTSNVTYAWTYNSLPFSNMANPMVNLDGIYRVTITDATGCQNNGSVVVLVDTLAPPVRIDGGSLSCTTTSITLQLSTRAGSTVSWTGPNSFRSNIYSPQVTDAGLYTVVVTGPNGCVTTRSIQVDNAARPFQLDFSLDSISCSDPIADISFTSALGNVGAIWTSPSASVFNGRSQSFTESGLYRLDVTSSDMCDTTLLVEVVADTLAPVINLLGNTELNCAEQILAINAIVDPVDAAIEWTFPDNTTSSLNDISASLAGDYFIQANSINGCQSMDTFTVTYGSDLPDPMTVIDSFDCETDTVTLSAVNNTDYLYQWNDGNMDLGTDFEQEITRAGYTYLTITDGLGCQARYGYDIPIDLTFSPASLLARDTLNCMDSVLELAPLTVNKVLQFNWTLNNAPFSMDSLIEIRQAGVYRLNLKYSSLCNETLVSRIRIDTVKAVLDMEPFDTLTCDRQFVDLEVNSPSHLEYEWSLNDLVLSNDSILAVTVPGPYIMQATADNFCVSRDTANVVQDTVAPVFDVQGDTINCAISKVNIAVLNPVDSWTYQWTGPNGFTSLDSMVLVRDTGLYDVVVTSLNGCMSSEEFEVIGDFVLPEASAIGGSLNCIDSSLELLGMSSTADVDQVWFGPLGFTTDDLTPIVRDTGVYVLLTTALNGCSVKDTVFVDDMPPSPDAQISLGLWDCSTTELPVEASSLDTGVVFDWAGPSGYTFSGSSPILPSFGDYMITYTGVNGCTTVIDTFIPTDTIHPYVEVYTNQLFRCEQRIITLIGQNSDQGPEYSYLWSTDLGLIVGDSTQTDVLIGDTGIYVLQLTNERNHCVNESSFDVIESDSDLLGIDFITENYGCLNGFNGQFEIQNITGTGLPFMFSYDDEPFVANQSWQNLLPDQYTLEVRDTFGCRLDTFFTIYDSLYLYLEITQDTLINLGDSILLTPLLANHVDLSDVSYSWEPTIGLSCTDCAVPFASPVITTQYCIEVTTSTGCHSIECILVGVNEDIEVIVPNAFTPNGDNINDLLIPIASDDVDLISLFQIYDRWGTLVYALEDVLPEDIVGWDGSFDGVELVSQVFVYRLEYQTLSHKIINQSGDLTLLR